MVMQNMQEEIIRVIRAMNRCWTAGWNEEEFRKYIHTDAIAIVPSVPGRLTGKEAYIAGWRGFAEAAVIHEWRETDYAVQVYAGGKAAVATYLFTITFAIDGHVQKMQGRDMFFFIKERRKWLVAADHFSPEPAGV